MHRAQESLSNFFNLDVCSDQSLSFFSLGLMELRFDCFESLLQQSLLFISRFILQNHFQIALGVSALDYFPSHTFEFILEELRLNRQERGVLRYL